MGKKAKIELPIAPLPDLMKWLRAKKTPAVVIGGLAVALLARPRVTHDLDVLVVVPKKKWPAFLRSGKRFGFVPRLPDPMDFADESRMLLVHHQPSGIDVDVSLGNLPFEEEAIARAANVKFAGLTVPLSTPEDLIIMKAVAGREQDLLDISSLVSAYPDLDDHRVRLWVTLFAKALDRPEILDDVEKRLGPQRRGNRPTKRNR